MKEFVAIDFETANPKRVSACAIGFAYVSNGEIVESKGYLVKPIGGHAAFQSKIHGIKEEHTIDKPEFGDLYPAISSLLACPLVAHSLFDRQVLNALAEHFSLPLSFEYTDTSALAKQRLPNLRNHKLKTLVKHLQLPPFKHHDATEDAVACARVYLKLQGATESVVQVVADSESDFRALVSGILDDDAVEYKEAYQLLYWLEDHPHIADSHRELLAAVQAALADDHLDACEANMLRAVLRSVEGTLE
ncbi:MAG: hypothetical protein HQ559_09410 [Lentisphaerae bacterium]|nr:hypothetical protein [Lentisphaerota bacterium]